MTEPRWLTREIVIVLQGELLAEHGGPAGIRDDGALRSALARPEQKHHYEQPDIPSLGAAYAFGLSSNHPFVDGNKRIALVALDVFLQLNGGELIASEVDTAATIFELAAGELTEESLAAWIRENIRER